MGKKVAYLQNLGHPTVYVADLEVGAERIKNLRHLTQTETWTWPDCWTPDSKALIFHSRWGERCGDLQQTMIGDSPELHSTRLSICKTEHGEP